MEGLNKNENTNEKERPVKITVKINMSKDEVPVFVEYPSSMPLPRRGDSLSTRMGQFPVQEVVFDIDKKEINIYCHYR
jgi:hypothetical protein